MAIPKNGRFPQWPFPKFVGKKPNVGCCSQLFKTHWNNFDTPSSNVIKWLSTNHRVAYNKVNF